MSVVTLASLENEYKAFCERIAVEAAVLKGETEVQILGRTRRQSLDDNLGWRPIHYDLHLSVWFPGMDRKAHVYLGPLSEWRKKYTRIEISKMKIWRKEGKPTIVLC